MIFEQIILPKYVVQFTFGDILGILVSFVFIPISVYLGYYVGKKLKSPIQKVEEENQKTAYKSIFNSIYHFDMAFRQFYLSFESHFLPIRELEPKFLPLEPAKMIRTKTTAQGVKKENFTVTFENFKNDEIGSFEWMFDIMKSNQKSLEETLKVTRNMIPVIIYNLLNRYIGSTMNYMKYFTDGNHSKFDLESRLAFAKALIFQLEKYKLSNENSEIKEFRKRWTEYLESERS